MQLKGGLRKGDVGKTHEQLPKNNQYPIGAQKGNSARLTTVESSQNMAQSKGKGKVYFWISNF